MLLVFLASAPSLTRWLEAASCAFTYYLFTLLLVVRDVPALLIEFSPALLLIVLTAMLDVSLPLVPEVLDNRLSGTCWTVGLVQDNASWTHHPVECSPFLAGSVVLCHSGFQSFAVPGLCNRWALQDNASWHNKSIDRSSLTLDPWLMPYQE